MDEIMVSVVCNAFNHEKYIEDALNSFVSQKTNFKYEVLVHDDASTDATADIIRRFEKEYPELIKPVYQTENQYSKGVRIGCSFQYPRARGVYIAFCEGDDYWTDEYKLQKQVDAMLQNPDCDMCAHAANRVWADSKKLINVISPKSFDTILTTEEVISGGGGYVATNSLMFKKSLVFNEPQFRKQFPIDYSLQILGSLKNGMLFLCDNMSDYRWMSEGAWTKQVFSNPEARKKQYERTTNMLLQLDKDTLHKYTEAINVHIANIHINETMFSRNVIKNLKVINKYKKYFKKYSFKRKLKVLVKACIPGIYKLRYTWGENK